MIRVRTQDGRYRFEGADARAVVRQMRDAGWKWGDPKRDYMIDVACRVSSMTGAEVRTTAEGFLEDLVALGLLEIVDDRY